MQDNGNKIRQQFKDMKSVLKLKIDAENKNLGPQEAMNLAEALTEMPQILVLEVKLFFNKIGKEGAASIA